MFELLLCIGGFAAGAGLAWAAAAMNCRAGLLSSAAGLKGQVSAAEAINHELRSHLNASQSELVQLRAKLDSEGQSRATTEGRLQASIEAIAEQKKLFADADSRFKDAFTALSAHALQSNNAEFAKQAEEKMKPLRDALERYEKQIREMDTKSRSEERRVGKEC